MMFSALQKLSYMASAEGGDKSADKESQGRMQEKHEKKDCGNSSAYERQMKKGALDMLVLRLLMEEQKYGYQLIMELREKSGSIFCLKEGTLYPILYRLEEEGLVESRWSEAESRQLPRKYYLMTDKGQAVMREMYQSWQQIVRGVEQLMEQAL